MPRQFEEVLAEAKLVKVWAGNWPLVFRDEQDLLELAARSKMQCEIEHSANRCLMMCTMCSNHHRGPRSTGSVASQIAS